MAALTDDELIAAYRHWSDSDLLDHRDASLAQAEVQVRLKQPKSAVQCRERARIYGRALALRGVRP